MTFATRMIHRICAANWAFSSTERRHKQTDLLPRWMQCRIAGGRARLKVSRK